MTFGDKLAKLRREQNYTQEQFADILGVSRQSVSKWESDLAYPETDKLVKICELFNCSSDYLLLNGGDVFQHVGKLSAELKEQVKQLIDETVPSFIKWAGEIVKKMLS